MSKFKQIFLKVQIQILFWTQPDIELLKKYKKNSTKNYACFKQFLILKIYWDRVPHFTNTWVNRANQFSYFFNSKPTVKVIVNPLRLMILTFIYFGSLTWSIYSTLGTNVNNVWKSQIWKWLMINMVQRGLKINIVL